MSRYINCFNFSACESYTYGLKCKFKCGNCHADQPCHVATGECSGGCREGWYGSKCDKGNGVYH